MIFSPKMGLVQKLSALLIGMSSVAMSAITSALPTQVSGQLIDLSCYSENKDNIGNHHINKGLTCAQACAREDFEVGLLAQHGTIYHVHGGLAANSNAKLIPHMSKLVTVTGYLSKENGQNVIASDDLQVANKE
jgi:hypothetical protein